ARRQGPANGRGGRCSRALKGSTRQPSGRGRRSDTVPWAEGGTMQRPKPVLLVILLAGATALSAPSAAGAASGPQTFTGTIVTDAASGARHIVKSIVVAHGAFNGVGT